MPRKKPEINSYDVLEIHSPLCLIFKAKKKKKKKRRSGLQVTVSEWKERQKVKRSLVESGTQ